MISNLEYCKVFYYVASCSSITTAAQKLYISQPAVSQSIKQLEQELNCTLFFRTSKGVKLTPEGEALFSHVRKAFDEINLGEKKLMEMLNMESGEIRIGASDMTLQFYLLPYLEQFHKLYPKVKISVSNGPTPETVRALREGTIDFGIVSSPVADNGGLELTEAAEIRDIFVAGKRFEHLKGKVLSFSELEKLPVICLEKNTSTRKSIDDFLKSNGATLSPEIELATSELIVRFAERNLGVGFVMSDFAKSAIGDGRLFEISLKGKLPVRKVCIAVNRKLPVSVTTEKMLELLNK